MSAAETRSIERAAEEPRARLLAKGMGIGCDDDDDDDYDDDPNGKGRGEGGRLVSWLAG